MKKRVLSMLLAICMVVGLLPGMALGAAAAEPVGEMTVYFQNNWLWTDVRFYYWNSVGTHPAWPGEAMELAGNDGNYDVYKATVPADAEGIIISGVKNDGSGNRDQTPNINDGWYDGICYYMKWENGNAVGSENIDVILPPPAAPNVDNVRFEAIYMFVCNTQLPAGQVHQPTGVAYDVNYFEAGEPVKNADGKWIAEVTCKVKAMWENYTSYIYENGYPDYAHTSDNLPETLTVTLTWDSEAEEWVYDGELPTYDISCTSTESSYVAEVDGQGFGTLAEAIAHAQTVEGSTLKLLQNLSLDTAITIDSGKFTIDLNGFVWENSAEPLYVKGSAAVKLTSTTDGGVLRGTTNSPTIKMRDTASLEIAGGTVENTGSTFAVDLAFSGNATDARLLVSGGKVTTNGSLAIRAFGSAVTVTGGILESALYEINYFTGSIDLSEHPDPTGIGIVIGYTITEAIVGTDVLLPAGYCLIDDATGELATTLVTDGTYTVAADSAAAADVAEVDGQGFGTLAEAIAHAQTVEGSTVKLLKDVSLDTSIDITGGKFTIDLNGFVWENSTEPLYVKGSAAVKLTSTTDGGVIRCATNIATICVWDNATLEIAGGTVENTGDVCAVNLSASGNATQAQLLVTGGKVTTNGSTAIMAFGSAVTVTGGILESELYEIDYYTGSIDLSGHPDPTGIGIGYYVTEGAVGMKIRLPAGYCLMDDSTGALATTLVTGGKYTVAPAPAAAADVAEVDGQGFETLAEAVAYAQTVEGSTLKLLQNLSLDTAITIDSGKFTIDLNGFVWENSAESLYVMGSAEVKLTSSAPGGVIRCTTNIPTVCVWENATLEIAGGTVENTGDVHAVSLSIIGHTTQVRLLVTGGKVTTNGPTAIIASGSTVTVTGGILESRDGEIEYHTGSIDLSEHPDPTGIGIVIGYTVTEAIVGTDVLLPAGYCLMDDATGEPATTLVTYGQYTVAAESATYSVVGSFSDWDPTDPAYDMTLGADGKYTLTKELPAGTYDFKIVKNHVWDVNYGCDTSVENGVTYNLERDGFNASFTLDADAEVTFIFDLAAKTITVSWEAASVTPEPATVTGVSLSGNGVTFDAETNTYYISSDATDITLTVTGTNFANLTQNHLIHFSAYYLLCLYPNPGEMTVDTENNIATCTVAVASDFETSDGHEICYSADDGHTWTGLGVYVTYVESSASTEPTVTAMYVPEGTPGYDPVNQIFVLSPNNPLYFVIEGQNLTAVANRWYLVLGQKADPADTIACAFSTYATSVTDTRIEICLDMQRLANYAKDYINGVYLGYTTDWVNQVPHIPSDVRMYYSYVEVEPVEGVDIQLPYGLDPGEMAEPVITLEPGYENWTLKVTAIATGLAVPVEDGKFIVPSGGALVTAVENTTPDYATKAELEAAIAELQQLIDQLEQTYGIEVPALQDALTALQQQVAALDDTFATDEDVKALSDELNALAQQIADLENTYATKTELAAEIARLEQMIADLELAYGGDNAGLVAELATLQTQLTALQNALDALDGTYATDADLDALRTELNALAQQVTDLAATFATKAELAAEIARLEQQIKDLELAYGGDNAGLVAELAALKQQLTDLQTALNALDDTYVNETQLTEAVNTINQSIADLVSRVAALEATYATKADLEQAIADLKKAIAEGDAANAEALEAAVAKLEKALADAVAALEKADADNKAALEAAINEAKTALEAAIAALEARVEKNETDIAQLQTDLAAAIEDLKKAIAEGDAANAEALEAAVAKLEKALADAVAALEKADADNKAALEAMIADTKAALETALADAVAKLEKADADNKAALEKMIDQLEAALRAVTDALDARVTQNEEDIAQLRNALEAAIADLKKAIAEGDEANAKALAEAVEMLTKALEDAVSKLEEADEKNRAELEALIAEAKATLEMAIARLRNELYVVRAELLTIMGEHDAVLDGKITELAAALEAAIAASQAADEALGVRIDETVAALNAAIAEAKAVLNAAIEQVAADLESARQLLNLSIANGDKALHDRIDDLTAALNAAVAAADAADEALRIELNARIDDAVSTLNAAIAQVQKNLDEAVAAMDAKNAAQDQTITIVLVIAIVGVAGCVALLVVFIIDKRKVK